MTLAAVGFEVSKPDDWVLGLHTEIQGFAVELGGNTEPGFVIIGRHGLVAIPCFVIGGLAGVAQLKMVGLAGYQAFGLEVEPLKVRAAGIGLDRKLEVQRVTGIQHLNIAAVEVTADANGRGRHGHRQSPGI